MATWRDDIVEALRILGGSGTYEEIYAEVGARRSDLPATWQAIVRGTIEQHSSDSANHKGSNDLFYSVMGLGKGIWGLRSLRPEPGVVPADGPLSSGVTETQPSGQGLAPDSVVRRLIEQYAVACAKAFLVGRGAVGMVELGKPYDLLMQLDGQEFRVEVKGSTRSLDEVTVTKNEVTHAHEWGRVGLVVVDRIHLSVGVDGTAQADGGSLRFWTDWIPSTDSLTAIVFRHRLAPNGSPESSLDVTPGMLLQS